MVSNKYLQTFALFLVIAFSANCEKQTNQKTDSAQAEKKLNKIVDHIQWTQNLVAKRARITELGKKKDLTDTLPPINQFPLTVNPSIGHGDVAVEILISAEKSGKGKDGWLVEVGEKFNRQNISISGGKRAKVKIRWISSGTGYQYIASGKHLPDAFSPSQMLWSAMMKANNVPVTIITDKLANNWGGVVMKEAVYEKIKKKYGKVDIQTIVNATVSGEIAMGYTDPYASSTGFNFLISVLATFANNDENKMLSPEVISSFRSFQNGVPFVALNTPQMRDSVLKGGSLDAFVLDMKTWRSSDLKVGYHFVPFGVVHNNPLFAIGNLSKEKTDALKAFAKFVQSEPMQKLSEEYGFNGDLQYKPPFETFSGNTLIQAQRIWKEEKDGGRPIAAIFLADISGSMRGRKMKGLKNALHIGADFIDSRNSVGLVSFDHRVNLLLPIQTFNLSHKSSFIGGVDAMEANGQTAMYDGIAVSLKLLLEEKKKNPKVRLMLFVLTDGQTNVGNKFNDLQEIITALGIPIYTIGYEANIAELKKISSLVEAASINANADDVPYQIGLMLNAEL